MAVAEALMPAVIEMWVEYAIGILVLFLRIFTRCKKVVGFKWQGDDYLAVAAIIFFTVSLLSQRGTPIPYHTTERAPLTTPRTLVGGYDVSNHR